jgi:hypothetical protein
MSCIRQSVTADKICRFGLQAAVADAKALVLRTWDDITRQPPAGDPSREDGWLLDTVAGCVGMLFTLQRCMSGSASMLPQGEPLLTCAAAPMHMAVRTHLQCAGCCRHAQV